MSHPTLGEREPPAGAADPVEADGALAFSVAHINASSREPINEDELLSALTVGVVAARHEHHLWAFFDEAEPNALADLVLSGAVTFADLAAGARRWLPPGHDIREWLDERS